MELRPVVVHFSFILAILLPTCTSISNQTKIGVMSSAEGMARYLNRILNVTSTSCKLQKLCDALCRDLGGDYDVFVVDSDMLMQSHHFYGWKKYLLLALSVPQFYSKHHPNLLSKIHGVISYNDRSTYKMTSDHFERIPTAPPGSTINVDDIWLRHKIDEKRSRKPAKVAIIQTCEARNANGFEEIQKVQNKNLTVDVVDLCDGNGMPNEDRLQEYHMFLLAEQPGHTLFGSKSQAMITAMKEMLSIIPMRPLYDDPFDLVVNFTYLSTKDPGGIPSAVYHEVVYLLQDANIEKYMRLVEWTQYFKKTVKYSDAICQLCKDVQNKSSALMMRTQRIDKELLKEVEKKIEEDSKKEQTSANSDKELNPTVGIFLGFLGLWIAFMTVFAFIGGFMPDILDRTVFKDKIDDIKIEAEQRRESQRHEHVNAAFDPSEVQEVPVAT